VKRRPGQVTSGARALASALLCAAVAGACGGEVGTLEVALVTAPDSDILDRIERVRVRINDPETVVEAERGDDGELAIDLEITAENAAALLSLEGFDAEGERIAVGRSAPLPISAVNASISLYVGPPLSMAAAPVELDPPRSEIGAARLSYGAIFVGGRGDDGEPVDDTVVYNVYDHALQLGLELPEPRASATVVASAGELVYVFGGFDGDGGESADGWSFNTRIAPAGFYAPMTSDADLARAGAAGVLVSGETFLVAGEPAVQLNGVNAQIVAWPGAPSLGGGALARVGSNVAEILIAGEGVGETGAVTYDGTAYRDVDAPAEVRRTGHALVTLPDGRGLVVGGEVEAGQPERSAAVYEPANRQFSVRADFLATARTGAAVAATAEVILVAGGLDSEGELAGDVELFDVMTLEPVATVPMVVPRSGAVALALANGQVVVAGGVDGEGAPVGVIELFVPE
jgi:hypothetical protein